MRFGLPSMYGGFLTSGYLQHPDGISILMFNPVNGKTPSIKNNLSTENDDNHWNWGYRDTRFFSEKSINIWMNVVFLQ